jgi:hypothetical protein
MKLKKIDNINGEVLQPEKRQYEAKENLPSRENRVVKKQLVLIDDAKKKTTARRIQKSLRLMDSYFSKGFNKKKSLVMVENL